MSKEEEETLTFTRSELAAFMKEQIEDSKMTDDEKKLRKIIRDETSRTMTEKLAEFFKFGEEENEEESSSGENDGGESGGVFDNVLKALKG